MFFTQEAADAFYIHVIVFYFQTFKNPILIHDHYYRKD